MKFARKTLPLLREHLSEAPVVWIRGARQVGKSTLAREASGENRTYLTLDDDTVLRVALADPQGFVLSLKGDVIIDEVQRVPELFRAIKLAVDRDRRPGRFLLTGSANVFALPTAGESLAGRMHILDLEPLAQVELGGGPGEFLHRCFTDEWTFEVLDPESGDKHALYRRAITGGYPEAVKSKTDAARGRLFAGYVDTLLDRDLREISDISRLGQVPDLLKVLASRSSELLNVTDVGRGLGIPNTTLERYLKLLRALFLYRPLQAYHANVALALARAAKVQLLDSGLAAHLLNLDADDIYSRHYGHLIETFVCNELHRLATWYPSRITFSHFRTKRGKEVDVVMRHPRHGIVGVEVKARRKLTTADFDGLAELEKVAGSEWNRGVVLYAGEAVVPHGRFWAVPMGALWEW